MRKLQKNPKTKTLEPRIDLTKYMVREDKPNGPLHGGFDWGWSAGDQVDALEYYIDPAHIRILAYEGVGDYEGEYFAILKCEGRIIIWRASFGSCSGCDGLEGENGYEYIKDTLQEGNTRQFENFEDAEDYIKVNRGDYLWDEFPMELFETAKRVKE